MPPAIQEAFAQALLERDRLIPPGLTTRAGSRVARRFAVHRTNVVAGLVAALGSRFPATQRIVGSPFYDAMARTFIDLHPPRSPVLSDYGDDLPGFVETFEPARDLPYLADVIRLEAARGRAYHAEDRPPLDPEVIAALPPERLPGLAFDLHPAASLIRSSHPVVTIWAMNADELDPRPIAPWVGEDALVTRPAWHVLVRSLPPGGGALLSALAAGAALGDAVGTALAEAPDFALATTLACLLRAGAVAAVR